MDPSKIDFDTAQQLFTVAASVPRLKILCALHDRELSVTQISEILGLDHSPVSQHLRWLRGMQLVKARRDGTFFFYRLNEGLGERLLLFLYRNFSD